jgi:hypothetical protein
VTIKSLFALLLSTVSLIAPPPGQSASTWTLYSWANNGNYNPSSAFGQLGDISTFSFPEAKRKNPFPAFLTTTVDTNMLGDLTGQTITATLNLAVTGNPVFAYGGHTPWSSWNTCPVPANTRLYFSTNPAAYDLQDATIHQDDYWWSSGPTASVTISPVTGMVTLSDTFDPSHWSNAQGVSAVNHLAEFQSAVANVRQIGVAFGGGCFFDVGIAVLPNTGTAIFHLISYDVQ